MEFGRTSRAMALAALALALALALATSGQAQRYTPAFHPDRLTDRPTGTPNTVAVLGTMHLGQLSTDLTPEMLEPVIRRLVAWEPQAIAVETMSGLLCGTMRRNPARYGDDGDDYCYDPAEAGRATGLDVPAANAKAEAMLADWPARPDAATRRTLAATFMAAGEPASALVQWLRLPEAERHAGDGLTPELVAQLDRLLTRKNEVDRIAVEVAARAGLERVWGVDDQSTYMGTLDDPEGYGAALSKAWDNPATKARNDQSETLKARLDQPDGLLDYYRALNDPAYMATAYRSDWGPALAEPSPRRFGRRYVSYWETRNLRMVANMREILGRHPGTRMLAIVGASHKGYYEAYLAQMRDVDLVDIEPILNREPGQ